MKIIASRKFTKQLDGLLRGDRKYEEKMAKILRLLDFDIKHPSLRLHKLNNAAEHWKP